MHELYRNLINSDPKVLATMVALFGTFVAAALASTGYLYRMRVEQKKSFRKVLYFLLEIRNSVLVKLFDPEAAAEQYFRHMEGRLKIHGTCTAFEIPEEVRQMIVDHFRNIVAAQCTDIETRLLAPFEEALLEMAAINPTLAYRLYGRENVMTLIDHTRRYESEVLRALNQNVPGVIGQTMRETSAKVKNSALNELSVFLDNDIRLLARACGIQDRLRCRSILKKNLIQQNQIDFDALDTFFDQFDRDIVASVVAQSRVDQGVKA